MLKKKKKEKREPLEPLEIKESVNKLKTTHAQKLGRIVFWAAVVLLLVKGVFSLIQPGEGVRMEQQLKNYQHANDLRSQITLEAAAAAEGFLQEYYTFEGRSNTDYRQRVSKYVAKNLEVKEPIARQVRTTVVSSKTMQIHMRSDDLLDVDVHLIVEYEPLQSEDGSEQPARKDLYLRVPLQHAEHQYAVVSQPSYIPAPTQPEFTAVKSYSGGATDSNEVKEIRQTLESFFSVYYGGTGNEVMYFLAENSTIEGAVISVQFHKIDSVNVYVEEGNYEVDVTLTVLDSGQSMQQRLYISLIKVGDKFYLHEMQTTPK